MALKDLVSKGVRGDTPPATTPSPPRAAPSAPPSQASRSTAPVALLDASVEFTGTITCQESIRIDGRCSGELYSDHSVIIGEPAVLDMVIEADSVIVGGKVNGDITARRKITLERTARVTGNLCTPGIVIQEGAKLEGRIVIGSEAEEQLAKQPAKSPVLEPELVEAEPVEAKPVAEERPASSGPASRPRKSTSGAPPPAS